MNPNESFPGVTFVLCAHTPRIHNKLLNRALESIWTQTRLPEAVSIAIDHDHQGAAYTRNRALFMANTEWIVFMDSDDILYPNYLQRIIDHKNETEADVVWPWFNVNSGMDPFPMHFGRQWDPANPHSFPITALVRHELAIQVGGFPVMDPYSTTCLGEDFPFWISLSNIGAKFSHLPERLWEWNHHSQNTSGLGTRW